VKAEFEESEGLGCSDKKEYDWFKRSGFDVFDVNAQKALVILPSYTHHLYESNRCIDCFLSTDSH
jgi:hypothetical protein